MAGEEGREVPGRGAGLQMLRVRRAPGKSRVAHRNHLERVTPTGSTGRCSSADRTAATEGEWQRDRSPSATRAQVPRTRNTAQRHRHNASPLATANGFELSGGTTPDGNWLLLPRNATTKLTLTARRGGNEFCPRVFSGVLSTRAQCHRKGSLQFEEIASFLSDARPIPLSSCGHVSTTCSPNKVWTTQTLPECRPERRKAIFQVATCFAPR